MFGDHPNTQPVIFPITEMESPSASGSRLGDLGCLGTLSNSGGESGQTCAEESQGRRFRHRVAILQNLAPNFAARKTGAMNIEVDVAGQ